MSRHEACDSCLMNKSCEYQDNKNVEDCSIVQRHVEGK